MVIKTKTPQTTQTLQEKLSEIDWDLLEQLDQEDEGQTVPMRDNPRPTSQDQGSLNKTTMDRILVDVPPKRPL